MDLTQQSHEKDPWNTQSRCSQTTQRDGVGRKVERGLGWGDTCGPMADSC